MPYLDSSSSSTGPMCRRGRCSSTSGSGKTTRQRTTVFTSWCRTNRWRNLHLEPVPLKAVRLAVALEPWTPSCHQNAKWRNQGSPKGIPPDHGKQVSSEKLQLPTGLCSNFHRSGQGSVVNSRTAGRTWPPRLEKQENTPRKFKKISKNEKPQRNQPCIILYFEFAPAFFPNTGRN